MAESDPILSISGLVVRYGTALALSGVDLDIGRGKVVAVLGSNGAGKSTLARACSGLVPSLSGTIRFDGQDVTSWNAERRRRAGLIYLPEGRGIFPSLTVMENVRLAIRLSDDKSVSIGKAFSLFPALEGRKTQRASSLSGGEQQMLSLVRALAVDPKLVVIDEPSLGLAPLMVDLVYETLERAKRSSLSIVLIEQFAQKALTFADDCVILRRGQVTWKGGSDHAPDQLAKHYFGGDDQEEGPHDQQCDRNGR